MKDIEGRELFAGDIVLMTRGNGVFKAEFTRETPQQVHFKYIDSAWTFYVQKCNGNDKVYKLL